MSGEHRTKVFLSYGRKDGSTFADRIAADLEKAGFSVWRDTARLEAPHPWDAQLEAAIKGCDVVVALLSPHAVRTTQDEAGGGNDSVCLDELSFARFSPPPTPIVPVLIAPCEPPFVVYRLQYIDFLAAQQSPAAYQTAFDQLAATIRSVKTGAPVAFRATRFDPIDFDTYLTAKTRDFVGRQWLLDEIEVRLGATTDEPRLLLVGEPGWGKTAFAAHLFGANPNGRILAAHFCRFDRAETLDPARFIESIAAMIAMRVPAFAAELRHKGDRYKQLFAKGYFNDAFEELVLSPLSKLDPSAIGPTPRVLLIDALDEAFGTGQPSIVELVASASQYYPPWLKLVATSRDRADVLSRFGTAEILRLDSKDRRNVEDVAAVIAARLASGGTPAMSGLAALIAAKADGNVLCATQLALAVGNSGMSADALSKLPRGLSALYRAILERRIDPAASDWPLLRSVLEMVTATSEPLPVALAQLVQGDVAGYATRRAVHAIADLLIERDDAIRLFHATLAEFLADTSTPYFVNASVGADRLAGFALTDPRVADLPRPLALICVRQLGNWLVRAHDIARLAQHLPGFYEKFHANRAATPVSMHAEGVRIGPDEEGLALRVAAARPDVALEIVRLTLTRGADRFTDSGARSFTSTALRPSSDEASRLVGRGIQVAFDLAKLGLGWARAIGNRHPELRPALRETLSGSAVLFGHFDWLHAIGAHILGVSGYFAFQALILKRDWQEIEAGLAAPA